MKILLAATPISGHVNPLLAAARILGAAGHELRMTTGSAFQGKVEATGARFHPLEADADLDLSDIDAAFPARKALAPGREQLRFDFEHIFINTIPAQFASLDALLKVFPADLILTETLFAGVLPFLLGARASRPAIAALGVSYLPVKRDDGAPMRLGLPLTTDAAVLAQYREMARQVEAGFIAPINARVNGILASLGAPPLPLPLSETLPVLADLYLQPCVPGLEIPRQSLPPGLRFIGALPPVAGAAMPVEIAAAVAQGKSIVLVTQGTLANFDLGQLLAPTLQALAGRDDLLVVATTGGRPLQEIPGGVPSNAYAATFLPFDSVMPHVDVLVTNGGYGTLMHALSEGIPAIAAGATEDKPEVASRLTLSGAGIDLRTGRPSVEALREAVNAVLENDDYRRNATRLAAEFAAYDAPTLIRELLEALVEAHQPNAVPG
jgi:UDP:flavonoid glycosyltransferase YjiC (YdhE family)